MSLPVMMTCWVRFCEVITSAHIYSNYGTSIRYFLSVFGFNFTILVKMHQKKRTVYGEMMELRATPAEVEALSVKAG